MNIRDLIKETSPNIFTISEKNKKSVYFIYNFYLKSYVFNLKYNNSQFFLNRLFHIRFPSKIIYKIYIFNLEVLQSV